MYTKTIAELAKGLKAKVFSSQELTTAYLQRIKQHQSLNAYITVTGDSAIAAAKAADVRIASGNANPLTGIPIAQKDIFCTQDVKTSCGSKMLDNFIAPYDATVVEKFKAAGAVMLGKLIWMSLPWVHPMKPAIMAWYKIPGMPKPCRGVHPVDQQRRLRRVWRRAQPEPIPAGQYGNRPRCAALPV